MDQRNLLLLVVVAFIAFQSDFTYADEALQVTNAVNSDSTRCSVRRTAAVEDEERIKVPSFLTNIFKKNPKVGDVVNSSPVIANAIKNPKISQSVKELQGKRGLVEHLKSLPGIRNFAKQLKTKPGPLTEASVKEIGAVAVKSSGKWKGAFTKVWVKYGAVALLVIGIFVLVTAVLVNRK